MFTGPQLVHAGACPKPTGVTHTLLRSPATLEVRSRRPPSGRPAVVGLPAWRCAYALSRQRGDDTAPPEIKPIILAQPVELPWEELSHLHFNDQVSYLIASDLSPSA